MCSVDGIDGDRFLRFCAGLLWKFSVTKPEYGRISLGRYQPILRAIAFCDGSEIPPSIDAFIIRLRLYVGDESIFANRAPLNDRHEVNFVRFVVGGCLVLVKLDKRPAPNFLARYMVRGRQRANALVLPAQEFEEYAGYLEAISTNEKLSRFLDRQEQREH
jgi:hypothetical protein